MPIRLLSSELATQMQEPGAQKDACGIRGGSLTELPLNWPRGSSIATS